MYLIVDSRLMQGLNKVLDQEMIKLWNDLYNSTDNYTDGWLSSGMYFDYNVLVNVHTTIN